MNKQEIIEEFRATVLRKIEQDETTEIEIIRIIEEKFNGIRNIFEQNGIDPKIIEEYADGNFSMLKSQIRGIYDARKDDILQQVDFIIKRIQSNIEEAQEQQEPEEERREQQRAIDEMSLIETDNNAYARRIAGELADSIADIRSHTNRVLDYRGISMSKIEDISEEIRLYINRTEDASEEQVYGTLEDDRKNTIAELISQYEDAIEEMKQLGKEDEMQSDREKDEFRKSLDAGISLEEQHKFASEVQWADVDEKEKSTKEFEPLDFSDTF